MHELLLINNKYAINRCIQMLTLTMMRNVIITDWVEIFLPEMQIKRQTISNIKKYLKKLNNLKWYILVIAFLVKYTWGHGGEI